MMNRRIHIILAVLLPVLPQMGLADEKRGNIQHDAEKAI